LTANTFLVEILFNEEEKISRLKVLIAKAFNFVENYFEIFLIP
jgi:hypothetical protein